MIVWSEPESYLQFSSSAIIVSQVVDSNLVFNHNSSYLVQLCLCCICWTTKVWYFLFLAGGWVVLCWSPMIFVHVKAWWLIFSNIGIETSTSCYHIGRIYTICVVSIMIVVGEGIFNHSMPKWAIVSLSKFSAALVLLYW